jgi:hypothetical protein
MALTEISHLDDEMADCVDNCWDAVQACEWCADQCAGHGEEMERCLRLCRDVADIADQHARFMIRNSEYSEQLAEACAEACEECAEECSSHDHDHCQLCAEVLPKCAESCRAMMA